MSELPVFVPAASVILHDHAVPNKVYLARRSPKLKFLGGFHAFPGGKVDPEDRELAFNQEPWNLARVAAIRELFEEAGVLLALDEKGNCLNDVTLLASLREQIRLKKITFGEMIARNGWQLMTDKLVAMGLFSTPPFSTQRFQTRFFHASCPKEQQPQLNSLELDQGTWGTVTQHLERWHWDEILLSPPVLAILEMMKSWEVTSISEIPQRFDEIPLERVRFRSWAEVVSVHCPGPAMEQIGNVILVGGTRFFLVDPGPSRPEGFEEIRKAIQRKQKFGHEFTGILLTHHHPDHVSEAGRFSEKFKVPIFAHPKTALKLAGKCEVHHSLLDGSEINLGVNPETGDELRLFPIFTPGHAEGHLVFLEPRSRTMLVGDLISTSTTILISPPDGHLGTYIHSLKLARDSQPTLLLPFHGCPVANGHEAFQQALEHREKRESGLLNALEMKLDSLESLALEIYRGLPEPLMRLAQRQLLAGLIKLSEEDKVESLEGGTRWRLKK